MMAGVNLKCKCVGKLYILQSIDQAAAQRQNMKLEILNN